MPGAVSDQVLAGQDLTHDLPDRLARHAAAVQGVSPELPHASLEVGRILAGRVAVAVCGAVGAGHGVGPLRAFSSCRRRLADSRLRQRSLSLEHSGEHVVVRGKAMWRAGWIGAGHMEQVSVSIGLSSRFPRA